ncbi:putative glutamate receptor 4 precursor [Penaeus vannamei]|uniref:Putative glutamate receptor 4 n=1 Tax=Penaeus vannamei TaxID=6689 RepID=A0A3R7QTQ1_PENVA|nr:putative glutamate receptor 4 precursor [Penaeus vannamei]
MSNRWLLLLVFAAIFALLASADSLASKRTSDPSKPPDGYLKIQVVRPRPDFQGGGRNATVLDLDDGETEAKGGLPEFLERKPRPVLTEEEAVSFSRMLVTILKKEMKNCDIVLAYDDGYRIPAILQELLRLPNPRKLIYVRPSEELPGQAWESSQCRGYVYLLQDLAPLLHLADTRQDAWDFSGKFVVVAPTKAHLEELALSNCGRKTENIAGIAKVRSEERERRASGGVYMNLLYWGAGVARINTWKRGRFTLPLALFPDKLSNLRGVVLEVVTFEWEPSVFYYRNKDGRVLFRYGTDIGVVNALSQVLNFTVAFKEPPKGEYWGREEENGSWSGMMGKLSRNEVDIGVGDLYMTIVRVGILDYTAPYDSELSCFMARTEPPLPRWQALAFPFQGFTWLAIFGGLVLTGPVLYLLARASNCW